MHRIPFYLIAISSLACGSSGEAPTEDAGPEIDGGTEPDRSDEFFAQDLVDVELTLPPTAWDQLRYQYRSRVNLLGGEQCSAMPPAPVYDYFEASIAINGEDYDRIGIRKKGFGSQSSRKPSLKVHLSKYIPGLRHLSLKRFVLNNNKSDDTNLRQCFSYRLMAAAGLPTPRCTFATVTVNGESLGVFTLVEEVRGPFLERHFGSSTGNLYEGESNDFRGPLIGFDKDNNASDPSRADISHAQTVLEAATAETAIADIQSLIDLDAFYRFWAAEVMIWHRDGYNGNLNNYFIYADPGDDGRFKFIPWGTDNVMRDETRTTIPHSTLAFGIISNLLYQTSEGRTRFYEELDDLMATVWSEDDINTWMDGKLALLDSHVRDVDRPALTPEVNALRATVASRRQVFADARAQGEPDWEAGLRGEICRVEVGTVTGTIDAEWNTLYPANYAAGSADVSLTVNGQTVPAAVTTAALSGLHVRGYDYIAAYFDTAENQRYFFRFHLPIARFFDPVQVGVQTPLISTAFFAGGYHHDRDANTRIANFEFDEGTFEATTFDKVAGGRVVISFEARVYER